MDKGKNPSKARRGIAFALRGIIALLLAAGALNNIFKTETAIANSKLLGYAEPTLLPLAILLLVGVTLYILPRTAVLGAVMLTAWFGGAVATHVIHQAPLPVTIIPAIFALLSWFALWLSDASLQSVIPFKTK